MKLRYIFFSILLILCHFYGFSQEKITPLKSNKVLSQYAARTLPLMKHGEPHVQKLPFFDDFSGSYVYPNDTLWLDNDVFVNTSFGINPPGIGVATFDGLDAKGQPYGTFNTTAPADTLTSTYIDLSTLATKDSLYLSFFFQEGGFGDLPEKDVDSLIVQFKRDSFFTGSGWKEGGWVNVWGTLPIGNKNKFRQAMIPIKNKPDTNYFFGEFQFRIIAYANYSGNLDHWNVDYIYINRGRTWKDTVYEDVAVYYPVPSILKNYYSMPWDQFLVSPTNNLTDSIKINCVNNSGKIKNVTFGYTIINSEDNSQLANKSNLQGDNVNPTSYRVFPLQAELTNYPTTPGKREFLVNTFVTNIPDDHRQNDTAVRIQVFDNYLAYDDGVAEAGYGIFGGRGKVALEFSLNKPDTLYGVMINFNRSVTDIDNNYFSLTIWNSLTEPYKTENDIPYVELRNQKPLYLDTIQGFVYYPLEEPVPVTGKFYVGWIQFREFNMNVGYDMNYSLLNKEKTNKHLFISTSNMWEPTATNGTPLIRPVIGKKPVIVSVKDQYNSKDIKIYPNPTTSNITISLEEFHQGKLEILDMTGKIILNSNISTSVFEIQTSDFNPGIYLMRFSGADGAIAYKKFIKQ